MPFSQADVSRFALKGQLDGMTKQGAAYAAMVRALRCLAQYPIPSTASHAGIM